MNRPRIPVCAVALCVHLTLLAIPIRGEILSGRVYSGDFGVEPPQSSPLQGVPLKLYGSNNQGELGQQIDSTTTASSGSYSLDAQSGAEYYTIVCEGKSGYVFQGASSLGGTVSGNQIEYSTATAPLSQQTLTGNKFWYKTSTPQNSPPVANAGPDQTAEVGHVVELNGSGSSDVDGDPLTYRWSLISVPAGSGAVLDNTAAVRPRFTADRPGTYVGQLIVNDGKVDSSADTAVVSVKPRPLQTGDIKGHKFDDANGDGIWGNGESGLAGWTIFAD